MQFTTHQLDWHLQLFSGGELVNSELVQADHIDEAHRHFAGQGYEVRAEPATDGCGMRPFTTQFISESNAEDCVLTSDVQGAQSLLPAATSKLSETEASKVQEAIGILEKSLRYGPAMSSPRAVRQFCALKVASEIDEHFCCLFLTSQHQLIRFEGLFRGSIAGSAVYPRVVVRRCLELNAAAVVFTHNHPSGVTKPSQADIRITQRLKEALNLFEIAVLDHIITGLKESCSMAEEGLL